MYSWTNWVDEVTEYEGIFQETDLGGGMIKHDPVTGQVYVEGTPQDAAHWNNMEKGIIDAHTASGILLNALRQMGWRTDALEKATVQETGEVTLNNSLTFPFNNSQATVALTNVRNNLNYIVEVISVTPTGGPAGDIEVSDRQINGFKIAFNGSASKVVVKYAVIGGYS